MSGVGGAEKLAAGRVPVSMPRSLGSGDFPLPTSPAAARGVPSTFEGLRSRIDTYGQRALLRAFDNGLEGAEAGAYVDRYVGKAISQLNRGLENSGADFRRHAPEYGRDAFGNEYWGIEPSRRHGLPRCCSYER